MGLLSFLRSKNKNIKAAFFHHGTDTSDAALKFLSDYCNENSIPLVVGFICGEAPKGESPEKFWREGRYRFLSSLDGLVATAHHLDDVAETYLFSIMRYGRPKFIKPVYGNAVRPILRTRKADLVDWCKRKSVPYIDDMTNQDTRYPRNRIRHNIMPEVEKVNPGFLRVVERLLQEACLNE